MKWLFILAAGTLASEDLTCIGAGQFIRLGQISPLTALLGCFLGVYLGDLGLWLIGRLWGRRLLSVPFVARRVDPERVDRLGRWFDQNSAAAILASRFTPGTRLPMYLAAGALGRKSLPFAGWTFLAALLWTPLVVLAVTALGDTVARPLHRLFGQSWIILCVALVLGLMLLRLPRLLHGADLRYRLMASVSRIWRWEFWPAWLFYLPLVPWIAWLTLRHRSFLLITAANPGIPHGGIVGESKFEILAKLEGPHVLRSRLINSVDDLSPADYPLILKPDAGQRGAGVRIIRSRDEAATYIASSERPVLAQQYHPGPHEAGVFYYRFPGEPRGHIFSVTDKHFPILTGDGVHTLQELIWRHPRFRMQTKTFFARHHDKLERILLDGEAFQLAHAGNHCQGTLFRDGAQLITAELECAIDRVARTFDGFLFGRFDVRYTDIDAFRAGHDFAIVELNGVTSESTNLYDPAQSIFWAYRTLFSQWSLLFQIAAANCSQGVRVSCWNEVVSEMIRFYRGPRASTLSD
jgi:membrane protein DedA with SNARE-associated domain